jgi:hypothetical protein
LRGKRGVADERFDHPLPLRHRERFRHYGGGAPGESNEERAGHATCGCPRPLGSRLTSPAPRLVGHHPPRSFDLRSPGCDDPRQVERRLEPLEQFLLDQSERYHAPPSGVGQTAIVRFSRIQPVSFSS